MIGSGARKAFDPDNSFGRKAKANVGKDAPRDQIFFEAYAVLAMRSASLREVTCDEKGAVTPVVEPYLIGANG